MRGDHHAAMGRRARQTVRALLIGEREWRRPKAEKAEAEAESREEGGGRGLPTPHSTSESYANWRESRSVM